MNRRRFIRSCLQALVSLPVLHALDARSSTPASEWGSARALRPLVDNPYFNRETILEIGRKYLRMKPDYSAYECLRNGAHPRDGIAGTDGRSNTLTAIHQKTRQDYESGNTDIVDGWVLSRNELEQFALQALQAGKQTLL